MNVAMIKVSEIDGLYAEARERLRALMIERAQRIVEDPDLFFAPDARDRELLGLIYKAKREFTLIEAIHQSARGEYVMLGCVIGEHKHCKRRVERDGALLVCGCECHKTKEVRIEHRNSEGEGEAEVESKGEGEAEVESEGDQACAPHNVGRGGAGDQEPGDQSGASATERQMDGKTKGRGRGWSRRGRRR